MISAISTTRWSDLYPPSPLPRDNADNNGKRGRVPSSAHGPLRNTSPIGLFLDSAGGAEATKVQRGLEFGRERTGVRTAYFRLLFSHTLSHSLDNGRAD